jgi:ubiquinone/menaquinone biosynthesis C-methylase UbiE
MIETVEHQRSHERAKYDAIFAGRCNDAHPVFLMYGRRDHWRKAWEVLKGARSLCDVGTGYGNLPRELFANGCRFAMGIDFAMPKAWRITKRDGDRTLILSNAAAHAIPLPDNSVQYATAFDVLEHLVPDEVDECLAELRRVARQSVMVSICYKPSVLLVDGENLHPTVRPKEWWVERLKTQVGAEVSEWKKYLRCDLNGLCGGTADNDNH